MRATVEATLTDTIRRLRVDPWLAHSTLFEHRHREESAAAHMDMVRNIYQPERTRLLIEGFRGIAKSTTLEEVAIVKSLYREFHNLVVVGASYGRACERLQSIKIEFEQNERLHLLFGSMVGSVWQEGRIVLANGLCIQALGRDQSTLGIKFGDWRPDAALIDDVEDPEERRNDAERTQTWLWFIRTFLPALDNPLRSWVCVLGTRRGVGSLPQRLEEEGWPTIKYPIEYLDEKGERRATWPAKFPLEAIDRMRETYRSNMLVWNQEYMCQAVSETDGTFSRAMLRVEPRPRTFQPVYAMYDPARTTNRQSSASTGKAVWSWLRQRLVIWKIDAQMWMPDEIVDDMFRINAEFDPTLIGFEKTGLSEWALQPIRHEQVRRGVMLPLRAIDAPRGKLNFIKALQPFFQSGEAVFAEPPPEEVVGQFLSFPAGRIDAPNALAYALLMRPAAPLYEDFGEDHVVEDLGPAPNRPVYLAANAVGGLVTGVLVQSFNGQLRVLADWVREGDPAVLAGDLHQEAAMEGDTTREVRERHRPATLSEALKIPETRVRLARMPVRWVLPPRHAERWNNVGLAQAVRAIPASLQYGGEEMAGRARLREMLNETAHGEDAVQVSDRAQWTLRAFAGGYCRAVTKDGRVADRAEEGIYKVLMEGLESFAAMAARAGADDADGDSAQSVAYTRDGRPYKSAMPPRG